MMMMMMMMTMMMMMMMMVMMMMMMIPHNTILQPTNLRTHTVTHLSNQFIHLSIIHCAHQLNLESAIYLAINLQVIQSIILQITHLFQ